MHVYYFSKPRYIASTQNNNRAKKRYREGCMANVAWNEPGWQQPSMIALGDERKRRLKIQSSTLGAA